MREANQALQVAKQLSSAAHSRQESGVSQEMAEATEGLEKTVGVVQHHDAITGIF